MNNQQFQWWGYKHENGTYQAKRFFDSWDLEDADESPFVLQVVQPFYCSGREEALKMVAAICGGS